MKWPNEKVRGWIYRILVAAGAVVGLYGIMTSEQIAAWLGIAIAILNIMPSANTSIKSEDSANL